MKLDPDTLTQAQRRALREAVTPKGRPIATVPADPYLEQGYTRSGPSHATLRVLRSKGYTEPPPLNRTVGNKLTPEAIEIARKLYVDYWGETPEQSEQKNRDGYDERNKRSQHTSALAKRLADVASESGLDKLARSLVDIHLNPGSIYHGGSPIETVKVSLEDLAVLMAKAEVLGDLVPDGEK